mgnify:CR=1 FL=1
MKIFKAENLFKNTDEKLNEHMDKIIEKIDFLGTIVGKNNYRQKLEDKEIKYQRIGVLYNDNVHYKVKGNDKIIIYRYLKNKEYNYFAEVDFSMKASDNFKVYNYFYSKKPKHKELFNAYWLNKLSQDIKLDNIDIVHKCQKCEKEKHIVDIEKVKNVKERYVAMKNYRCCL